MKKLIPFLIVIVYMNNGHVYKYLNGASTCTNEEFGGLFDGGHSATALYVSKDRPGYCNTIADVLAVFPLIAIERIEIK